MRSLLLPCLLFFSFYGYAQLASEEYLIVDSDNEIIDLQSSVSADLDGDGDLDVISKVVLQIQNSSYPVELWWFENIEGPGNFSTRKLIAEDIYGIVEMFPADIDNDNDLDLVILNNLSNGRLSWFENLDGQGNFSSINHIVNSINGKLFVEDLDGDSLVDLIVGKSSEPSMVWVKNLGGGSFSAQQLISNTLNGISSITVKDLDNDGTNDIIATSETANSLYWFRNLDGLGSFGNQEVISTNLLGAQSVYAEDLNNDNSPDLLVASEDDNTISWFENTDGQGNFSTRQNIDTNAGNPMNAIPIDIDQDGHLDIVIGEAAQDQVAWFLNDGSGAFGPKQIMSSNFTNLKHIHASSLENNGVADILLVDGLNLKQFSYNGTDAFVGRGALTYKIIHVFDFEANDINGDGFKDMVISGFNSNLVWLRNINGTGGFCCRRTIDATIDSGRLTTIDIDNDGDYDVVGTEPYEGKVYLFENLNGFGNFGPRQEILNAAGWMGEISTADINSDGLIDIVLNSDDIGLSWLRNLDGQGNFDSVVTLIPANNIWAIVGYDLKDIDGDNDLDLLQLVYSTSTNYTLGWRENLDGLGTFSSENNIIPSTNDITRDAKFFDVDNDGDLDVVFLRSNSIFWYENTDGQGTISSSPNTILAGSSGLIESWDIMAEDFDNDNDLDVLFVDNLPKWIENTDGQGNFGVPQVLIPGDGLTENILPVDMDNDGDLDIIKHKGSSGFLYWLRNTTITLSSEAFKKEDFKIFPNPVSSTLTIESPNTIEQIVIYNQLGQFIQEYTETEIINVSNLPRGMYFIRMEDSFGNSEVKQFIKN